MQISDEELKARHCLASGSYLIDPKYLHPQAAAEEKLKERCRVCWSLRAHFPEWVNAYVRRWTDEGKPPMTKQEQDWAA